MTTGFGEQTKPLVLKPRTPPSPHKLPRGWRWLRVGEWAKIGDYCCNPNIAAVRIKYASGRYGAWKMTAVHYPVRRKLNP